MRTLPLPFYIAERVNILLSNPLYRITVIASYVTNVLKQLLRQLQDRYYRLRHTLHIQRAFFLRQRLAVTNLESPRTSNTDLCGMGK